MPYIERVVNKFDMLSLYNNTSIAPPDGPDWFLNECMSFLRITGCRPIELIDLSKWSYIGEYKFILYPAKGNKVRTSTVLNPDSGIWGMIKAGFSRLPIYNYWGLLRAFQKHRKWGDFYVENKPIELYFYRHMRVYNMLRIGISEESIINFFGWKDPSSFLNYKNSIIIERIQK